jgi:hypothetical protein
VQDDIQAAIDGDAAAVRRIARQPRGRIAAALAEVALGSTSAVVIDRAASALASRKRDPAAIPALQRFLSTAPAHARYRTGLEWAAIALAERKEPRAIRAAIASYLAMRPRSRERYFLIQTLSNRTERDRALRAHKALADLLLAIARGRDDERAEAVWALARIAAPRQTAGLIELLAHRDAYVQQTAASALARIATPAARAAVGAFLERCKDPEVIADLLRLLRARAMRRRVRA